MVLPGPGVTLSPSGDISPMAVKDVVLLGPVGTCAADVLCRLRRHLLLPAVPLPPSRHRAAYDVIEKNPPVVALLL